jgi:hypothetical protein
MDTGARRTAFAVVAAITAILSIAVARLPESFIAQLERSRPFTTSQAGWAYRILALVAIGQALWAGFALLRPEKVVAARRSDPKLADVGNERMLSMTAHTAAFIPLLTLVYGVAALWLTGQRGGFWLFVFVAVVQTAWYYRLVGDTGKFLAFQPEPKPSPGPEAWIREPPDYCPPLARGLNPIEPTAG